MTFGTAFIQRKDLALEGSSEILQILGHKCHDVETFPFRESHLPRHTPFVIRLALQAEELNEDSPASDRKAPVRSKLRIGVRGLLLVGDIVLVEQVVD